jgi:hypothetical protein
VQWSIAGGLFDPDDRVTIQAIAAVSIRRVKSDGAAEVIRARLAELYERARHAVRREVVVCVRRRPELGLSPVPVAARRDPAWSVRREATSPAE